MSKPPTPSFRDKPFEERLDESERIREKFPERLPVIVERAHTRGGRDTPELDRSRFLVPQDLTLGQLVYVIRRRLSLPADRALFVFCGSTLPPATVLLRELFAANRDPDGFLYLSYSSEASFGAR